MLLSQPVVTFTHMVIYIFRVLLLFHQPRTRHELNNSKNRRVSVTVYLLLLHTSWYSRDWRVFSPSNQGLSSFVCALCKCQVILIRNHMLSLDYWLDRVIRGLGATILVIFIIRQCDLASVETNLFPRLHTSSWYLGFCRILPELR